ncbi:MAG: UV DNA damage repair endonuclease UvsE [Firmicutes bacterium]|nr:UV DNA damage repair endonuclease UvsE [Bacillota bacterium]
MRFRLGYVAISLTLEEIFHYRTISYTDYQKLSDNDKKKKLDEIIKHNLNVLKSILYYNLENNIYFYRLNHNMIPLATHDKVDFDYILPYKKEWEEIGQIISKNNMRIDIHPDQFCVLNSHRTEVLDNSFKILEFNNKIFDAMNYDDGKIILHIGGAIDGKDKAICRFKNSFNKLDISIRNRIILENDDKIYTLEDTLFLCEELSIPMVLDYHHYICNHTKYNLEKYLDRILATWDNSGLCPKIHFSSPKSRKEKRAHSFYINFNEFQKFLGYFYDKNTNLDIMLECKGKDEALFRLVRQLKVSKNLKFDNLGFYN